MKIYLNATAVYIEQDDGSPVICITHDESTWPMIIGLDVPDLKQLVTEYGDEILEALGRDRCAEYFDLVDQRDRERQP